MLKILTYILISILGFFITCAPASSNASPNAKNIINQIITITPPKHIIPDCALLTGTWSGFITDTFQLYDNGGPWGITVYLHNQPIKDSNVSQIIGYIDSPYLKGKIWGECEQGRLNKIFVGNKGACGGYAHPGQILSDDALLLNLHHENAMAETEFVAILKRISNKYPYAPPAKPQDFMLGKIETCH